MRKYRYGGSAISEIDKVVTKAADTSGGDSERDINWGDIDHAVGNTSGDVPLTVFLDESEATWEYVKGFTFTSTDDGETALQRDDALTIVEYGKRLQERWS